ncbi:dromaiocalcin-2-like [Petaurus breviceps papuanus]|uniref:dromaiocalcin-2-like n=1 Tax=Petaurus breviceps papuanus TaxID=3040969 RepID=UPI0036DB34BF
MPIWWSDWLVPVCFSPRSLHIYISGRPRTKTVARYHQAGPRLPRAQGLERMGLLSLNTPCLFLGCLLLSTFGEDAVANKLSVLPRCPPDTLSIGGKCFEIFEDPLSWADAYAACTKLRGGSFLATIPNKQELNVLTSFITDFTDSFKAWIGLSKVPSRPWRWADGSRYQYKAWASYADIQPKQLSCAALDVSADSSDHSVWVSESCDNQYPFICKFVP